MLWQVVENDLYSLGEGSSAGAKESDQGEVLSMVHLSTLVTSTAIQQLHRSAKRHTTAHCSLFSPRAHLHPNY